MSGLAILLYVEDPEFCSIVESELEGSGRVQHIEKPHDVAELTHLVGTSRYDAIYVELGKNPAELLEVLELVSEPRPALLLSGSGSDSEVLVRAMRLRPEAFLVDRDISELPQLLERLDLNRAGTADAKGVIAVTGAKGGVGTTLIACELAANLQRAGDRVAIVDLNLHQGDVCLYFDVAPPYSLADVARKGDSLDSEFLRTISGKHELGLSVLAAPRQFEDVGLIAPEHIERAIRFLRRDFDWIVLDVPQEWNAVSLKALDLADQVLLVTSLEVPALTHTRERLRLLERLGADDSQIRIVLNRADSGEVRGWDLEKALGRLPDVLVPSNYDVTLASINEGKLVRETAPGGKLDLAIQGLSASVYDWFGQGPLEVDAAPSLARRIGGRLGIFRDTAKGAQHGTA